MTRCITFLMLVFIYCSLGCNSSRPLKKDEATGLPIAKKLHQLDTIDEALLRGRSRAMFRVTTMPDAALDDEAAPVADSCHRQDADCKKADFRGCDRKAAKLSFSNTPNQKEPLQHLIDRVLAIEPTIIRQSPWHPRRHELLRKRKMFGWTAFLFMSSFVKMMGIIISFLAMDTTRQVIL
jgi:hypothetical protein